MASLIISRATLAELTGAANPSEALAGSSV